MNEENPEIVQLTQNISYLPSTEQPLSCNVIFIKTEDSTWIFDTGCNKKSRDEINRITGPKNIVISHFHPDHILNLIKVDYDKLFVSKNTKKYTFKGTVVDTPLEIDCEPAIKILPFPSSHAKGCLALICGDYAFLGDGTYCKPTFGTHTYNAQLLQQMISVMEAIPARFFCLSHAREFVQTKEDVIGLYKKIYQRRTPDSPLINVQDFFNDDGSVKEDI